MMYLTGASNESTRAAAYEINLGIILNPESHYEKHVTDYPAFAIDNGCFSQGERFSLPRYLRWLKRLQPYQHKCLFAVAPDVFNPTGWHNGVTIAETTWERSRDVLPMMRLMGA